MKRIPDSPQSRSSINQAPSAPTPNRPLCQIVAPTCAIVRGVVTESSEAYELSDVVETALARALVLAAEAKRWDVVVQIADELHGRRVGRLEGPRVTKVFG